MQITNVETRTLLYRYPSESQYMRNASGWCNARVTTLVWIHTDAGITGIGSVYSHPDLVRLIIEDHLQPMLCGQDPLEVANLWNLSYDLTRWYGRKGVAMSAIGGIDTALWIFAGKSSGSRSTKLLGGSRTKVEAYGGGMVWQERSDALRDEALRHTRNGFRAMKKRIGRSADYDRSTLATVRRAIGNEFRLMADANSRYTTADVRSMMPSLLAANLFWLEELFPSEEVAFYAALRRSGDLQIAAGENEFGLQGFREMIEMPLVNIAQPD